MKRFFNARLCGLLVLMFVTLSVSAFAAFEGAYVLDNAGVLSDEQAEILENQAASMADSYNFSVYLVTVDDFTEFGFDDVYDCAVEFYKESELSDDGELLFLSMNNRKYALVYHGYGDTAFTEYGRDLLEDAMLDCFRDDDWYGGFQQYIKWSDYLLLEAAKGTSVGWDQSGDYHPDDDDDYGYDDLDNGPSLKVWLIIIFVPILVAGGVCAIFALQLTSVHTAVEAKEYAVKGSLNVTKKSDRFTHVTENRVKVESDNDKGGGGGGSSHHSGGGFSGRSGSF